MYGSGVVFILCLLGASLAQDEFEDSGSHKSMIPDDRDPLRADQPVFDHPKNEIIKKETQVANAGCSYHGGYTTCCGWIYVSTVSYHQYTCVKFSYYKSSKIFYTWLHIGYWSYYTGTIGVYHPVTRCAQVYMYYVKQYAHFCVELANLKATSYAVHGRALISVWQHGHRLGYYCLGYFTASKTAEKTKLADVLGPDMIKSADDGRPAAKETRQDVPPPRFRDSAVAMEIMEEPLTADAIEAHQDVPPPGFLGNPVAMEIMEEPLENNQMI